MADLRISDELNLALHNMVRDYGAENLGAITQQSAGVIYNKTQKAESLHNQTNVGDLVVWTKVTRNLEPLRQLCIDLGGVYVAVDHLAVVSDTALLELMLKAEKERGEFANLLSISLEKGCITPQAMARLRKESMDAIAAELALLQRLEGMRCE